MGRRYIHDQLANTPKGFEANYSRPAPASKWARSGEQDLDSGIMGDAAEDKQCRGDVAKFAYVNVVVYGQA
jgi:hypothetical protein